MSPTKTKTKISSIRSESGFTLLEIIVSLAIFTMVAVFAVGSLLRITALNRQAQTLQSAMNNISFALESMSREIRVGSKLHCETGFNNWQYNGNSSLQPQACNLAAPDSPVSTLIAFESSKTDPNDATCRLVYAYAFVPRTSGTGWSLEKAEQRACNEVLHYNPGNNSFVPIIDEANVTLTGFEVGVQTQDTAKRYAWAFVRLKGYAGTRTKEQHFFDVQTAISERLHD